MSEQKRFTAQEMRELSNRIWDYEKMSSGLELTINAEDYVDCEATQNLIAMLRQAADAEEELAQLKARLEAVVKECEKSLSRLSCTSCRSRCKMDNDIPECENSYLRCEVQNYNAILRAARGESENENK